jgi:hypothetical protein
MFLLLLEVVVLDHMFLVVVVLVELFMQHLNPLQAVAHTQLPSEQVVQE